MNPMAHFGSPRRSRRTRPRIRAIKRLSTPVEAHALYEKSASLFEFSLPKKAIEVLEAGKKMFENAPELVCTNPAGKHAFVITIGNAGFQRFVVFEVDAEGKIIPNSQRLAVPSGSDTKLSRDENLDFYNAARKLFI